VRWHNKNSSVLPGRFQLARGRFAELPRWLELLGSVRSLRRQTLGTATGCLTAQMLLLMASSMGLKSTQLHWLFALSTLLSWIGYKPLPGPFQRLRGMTTYLCTPCTVIKNLFWKFVFSRHLCFYVNLLSCSQYMQVLPNSLKPFFILSNHSSSYPNRYTFDIYFHILDNLKLLFQFYQDFE
jgi:hypothetical protein